MLCRPHGLMFGAAAWRPPTAAVRASQRPLTTSSIETTTSNGPRTWTRGRVSSSRPCSPGGADHGRHIISGIVVTPRSYRFPTGTARPHRRLRPWRGPPLRYVLPSSSRRPLMTTRGSRRRTTARPGCSRPALTAFQEVSHHESVIAMSPGTMAAKSMRNRRPCRPLLLLKTSKRHARRAPGRAARCPNHTARDSPQSLDASSKESPGPKHIRLLPSRRRFSCPACIGPSLAPRRGPERIVLVGMGAIAPTLRTPKCAVPRRLSPWPRGRSAWDDRLHRGEAVVIGELCPCGFDSILLSAVGVSVSLCCPAYALAKASTMAYSS